MPLSTGWVDSVAASSTSTRPLMRRGCWHFSTQMKTPPASDVLVSHVRTVAGLELPPTADEQLVLQCPASRSLGEIKLEPAHPAEHEQPRRGLKFDSCIEVREIVG